MKQQQYTKKEIIQDFQIRSENNAVDIELADLYLYVPPMRKNSKTNMKFETIPLTRNPAKTMIGPDEGWNYQLNFTCSNCGLTVFFAHGVILCPKCSLKDKYKIKTN